MMCNAFEPVELHEQVALVLANAFFPTLFLSLVALDLVVIDPEYGGCATTFLGGVGRRVANVSAARFELLDLFRDLRLFARELGKSPSEGGFNLRMGRGN